MDAPTRCALLFFWTSACATSPTHQHEQDEENDPSPDARVNAPSPDAAERPDAAAVVPPDRPDGGPGGSGCGPITEQGLCAGSTLKYCQNNLVVNQDCNSTGTSCQCPGGYCDCLSGGTPNPTIDWCGGLSYGGDCYNGYLEYCDYTGTPVVVDCWASGMYCDCNFFGTCDCYW
jgi:hypothetical protein